MKKLKIANANVFPLFSPKAELHTLTIAAGKRAFPEHIYASTKLI